MRRHLFRYGKILLPALLVILALCAFLYFRPRPFTEVYGDIDWEQVGEEIRVIYMSSDVETSTTTFLRFVLPTEALQEVLEETDMRRPFPSSLENGTDLFIFFLPAVEEGKQYRIWIEKDGYLECRIYPDVTAAGKPEEWTVTGGEPFEGLYALIENLEPTQPRSALAS